MAEPKIKYDIETAVSGEQGVEQLEATLTKLGETLDGDLKEQANQAAAALSALGAKRDAIVAFQQLDNASKSLVVELAEASGAVQRLAQELPAAAAATQRFASAEAAARTATDGAKRDLDEMRGALVQLRSEYTGAQRRTDEYREANSQLLTTISSLRTNLREKQQTLKAAEQQTATAAQAEKKLSAEYTSAADAANRMRGAVVENGRALDAARSSLQSFGVGTANLAQSERNLEAAIGQVRERVQTLAPAFGQAAAASSAATGRQIAEQRTLQEGVRSVGDELRKIQAIAAVALSGGVLGGAIKDVAATADEFRNLEARIKLATGEGAAFTSGFTGVTEVALRTNSALEETGTLFTRIAKAGTEAGLGAAAAQAQALSLTETINQAIQLSGGSADASKAAITQLIQGLQSGVLRGEEFNSVMEQAPRLAQALADGIGVTTGELRKMAEQGALTSATVINALSKQSDAVAAEFNKLPPTIGRALQNLETQWTLYVGAADNGMASSANVARVIDGLSKNLDTLVSVLVGAGKAWAAIKIVGLLGDLYRWMTTTVATTAAIEANTVATAANTVATRTNAVAKTAAAAANAAAWKDVGASLALQSTAQAGATAAAGRTTAAMAGQAAQVAKTGIVWRAAGSLLGPFGIALAALGPELTNVGRWLGETAAKWTGAGKAIEEYERLERNAAEASKARAEERRREAIAAEEAIQRQFDLSKAAAGQVATFDALIKKGDSAADAIGKIGRDFDLASVPGIQNAGAVLDKLAADGKISATQFRDAWAQALSGEDLGVFEVKARAAFAGSTREVERLAAALDATAREAIRRTGLDFEQLAGGVGAASRSAMNDTEAIITSLQRLEAQGVDTATALTVSIGKGIDTADSQRALDGVRAQIEAVRKQLGDKVADGLLQQASQKADELKLKLDQLKPGIQSAAEAMNFFGLQSATALKETAAASKEAYDTLRTSGTASADQLRQAFLRTASDAIAANNGIAPSWLTVEAALRGVSLQTDRFGRNTIDTLRRAGDAWRDYGTTMRREGSPTAGMIGKSQKVDYKSVTGSTREERLSGQNAVDASLQFKLLEKLNAGTLTEDDADSLRAVIESLRQQADINESARSMNAGFQSIRGQDDAFAWQVAMGRFSDALDRLENGGGLAGKSTTHTVNVKVGNGRTKSVGVASEEDAAALIDSLSNIAKRSTK